MHYSDSFYEYSPMICDRWSKRLGERDTVPEYCRVQCTVQCACILYNSQIDYLVPVLVRLE